MSITVPAQFDHMTPHRPARKPGPYRSTFQHARVVALFHHPLPDTETYYEVDHLNTDTKDDRPCNLRWRRPVDHRANAHQDRARESADAVTTPRSDASSICPQGGHRNGFRHAATTVRCGGSLPFPRTSRRLGRHPVASRREGRAGFDQSLCEPTILGIRRPQFSRPGAMTPTAPTVRSTSTASRKPAKR